jgi:hypothetical protein
MQNRNAFFSVQGAKTGFLYGGGIMANLIFYCCVYDLVTGSLYADHRHPELFLFFIGLGAATGAALGALEIPLTQHPKLQ